MAKNKHPKRELARKMLSKIERKYNVPVFFSNAWNHRSQAIKTRVAKVQGEAHKRAVLRKKNVLAGQLGIGQAHMERRTSRYETEK